MAEVFVNDAQTTINQAGGIGASDTSFTVTDPSEFPTVGEFRVRVDDELMFVTSVVGSTFTVTRSIESTVAVGHSNGAFVTSVFTAGAVNDLSGGGGGGSITLGGDLGPWTPASPDHQRVVGIDTIQANLATTAAPGYLVTYQSGDPWLSPRALIVDGDEMWVAEQDQSDNDYHIVRRVSLLDNSVIAEVDLSAGSTQGVRDLDQDDDYVYCACWKDGYVAIIEKASNTVVGWGTLNDTGVSGRQVTSVCADNLGNFYIVGWEYDTGRRYCIARFSTAACLGAAPEAVFPSQVIINSDYAYFRKVRYWNGSVWVAGGTSGYKTLVKFDPATLAILAESVADETGMNLIFAEGHIWVAARSTQLLYKYDTNCNVVDSVSTAPLDFTNGLAYNSGYIGVAGVFDQDFLIVNTTTMTVDSSVATGREGWGSVVAYGSKYIVAGYDSDPDPALYEISGGSISVLSGPGSLILAEPPPSAKDVTARNYTSSYNIPNEETVTICDYYYGRYVYLPTPLADGEKHTVIDGSGRAYSTSYPVRIYQGFTLLARIQTTRGSLTFIWSEDDNKWWIV